MRFFPRSTLPTPFSLRTSGQFDGNDGQWSTFLLSVGKPAQQFRVLASTSSMLTWVPKDDGCAGNDVPANCSEWRGVDNVKGGRSDGYIEDFSADFSFTNLFALPFSAHREPAGMFGRNDDVGWSYAFGVRYGTDTMAFSSSSAGGGLQTPHPVPFAMMTRWDYWLGSISLVPWYIDDSTGKEGQGKQTLLEMLANSSAIPSRSYGYTAGAYYRPSRASLVLGGYDASRFKRPPSSYKMFGDTPQDAQLGVTVNSILLDFNNGTSVRSVTVGQRGQSGQFEAIIDSTLPYLYLPQSICDEFASALALSYDSDNNLYTVTPAQRAASSKLQITIVVSGREGSNNTQETTFTFPYAAFDTQSSFPFYSNGSTQNVFPIRRKNTTNILGRTFLQEAYLLADFERLTFELGQAVQPSSSGQETLRPIFNLTYSADGETPASESGGGGKLGTGAMAGIVVAAVMVGLALLGLAAYFLVWRPRQRRLQNEALQAAKSSNHVVLAEDPKLSSDEARSPGARSSRRDTAASVLSGNTETWSELDGTVVGGASPAGRSVRPGHVRQVSELSSDSEVARGTASPGLDNIQELEDKNDTTAWAINQREEERRAELP